MADVSNLRCSRIGFLRPGLGRCVVVQAAGGAVLADGGLALGGAALLTVHVGIFLSEMKMARGKGENLRREPG